MNQSIRKTNHILSAVCLCLLLLVVSIVEARPSSSQNLGVDEIGELFIFGIPGPTIDSQLESHLLKTCPGSVLLFKRNLNSQEQVFSLITKLRELHAKCSRFPLFVAVDQEGGVVSRLPFDPPLPSAWSLGQAHDPQLVQKFGREVGRVLRKLGFNMNLAPVLDVGSRSQTSFISTRSFGDDPELVGETATHFSLGLLESRVLPVAKHFPGLGPSAEDPHRNIVRRSVDRDDLEKKDLIPFRLFSELYPSAIMPSHLVYPALDDSLLPATYSKQILINRLRQDLNFNGLVVSDDLQMRGAQTQPQIGQSVLRALRAGVDIAMISWSSIDQQSAVSAVSLSITKHILSVEEAKEKVEKIRKIKRLLGESSLQQISKSKELLIQGSLNYTNLAAELLVKNLSQIQLSTKEPIPNRIFIWPPDSRTRWQVERVLNIPVLDTNSAEFFKIQPRDLILSFIRSKALGVRVLQWDKRLRKQTYIINQSEPGLNFDGFKGELPLFMSHPMLAHEVSKKILKTWTHPRPLSE